MADSVSFRTRARTIDHLGREQIADCPTAVSELWKNAYDAYAKKVALHIYDGEVYASGNHIFTAGTQLCGNSSSIALALCVGNR
ncbi:MAG: hypothetical protein G8D88_20825, partial [gamma proteobacterium symbiont of Ctena orbiculata]